MPHSDHLDQWDRRRELADPRPCTLPTRAPTGMLGAWSLAQQIEFARAGVTTASVDWRGRVVLTVDVTKAERGCAVCGRTACDECRLDDTLAAIHSGQ